METLKGYAQLAGLLWLLAEPNCAQSFPKNLRWAGLINGWSSSAGYKLGKRPDPLERPINWGLQFLGSWLGGEGGAPGVYKRRWTAS